MRSFPVKAIDAAGIRWQFDQVATTVAEAERLVFAHLGELRYLFVRRAAA